METTTTHQSFMQSSIAFICSKTLERAGYYGLRTVLILYMVGETLAMEQTEAFSIYGILAAVVILTQIIGALLGDLLVGNKTTALIGGVLQTLGAFVICIPSITGLYFGLGLIALGTGLYIPNVFSLFGKLYKTKNRSLDAGFTLFYTAINTGAFLGVLLVGFVAEMNYTYGFIVAGILLMLGTLLLFFGENQEVNVVKSSGLPLFNRAIIVLIAVFVTSIFWTCYKLGSTELFSVIYDILEGMETTLDYNHFSSISSLGTILFGFIAGVLWFFLRLSRFLKIGIGFFLGALSFILLLLVPSAVGNNAIALYILSLILMSLSEILVAPIAYALLVKYANPKYLAILFTILIIPTYLFNYLTNFLSQYWHDQTNLGIKLGIGLFLLGGIAIFLARMIVKKITTHKFEETPKAH